MEPFFIGTEMFLSVVLRKLNTQQKMCLHQGPIQAHKHPESTGDG